jgi:hypothetical protein
MSNEEKTEYGRYDDKGYWKPDNPCGYSPLFQWPMRPLAILRWLFGWGGYLWPRHVSYVLLAGVTWYFLQTDLEVTTTLSVGWIAMMLLRNLVLLWLVFGFYHLSLYILKIQGKRGKYDPKWQEKGKKKFLFKNQVLDNIFWTCVSGAPIWTAYEVFYVWAAANGRVPLIAWASNPIWFVAWFFIIPLWRETPFLLHPPAPPLETPASGHPQQSS